MYQNNAFGDLYSQRFPNSYAGLQATLPIFTGFRRTQNLRRARLQDTRIDEDLNSTRNQINTEYAQALAAYKSNYSDYLIGKRNLDLSKQVYTVVDLQYREGIKAYIELAGGPNHAPYLAAQLLHGLVSGAGQQGGGATHAGHFAH